MEDLGVFGAKDFFFVLTSLRIARQGLSCCICFALAVVNSEVVTRQFLSPLDLSQTEAFCIHKLTEVVMVGQH